MKRIATREQLERALDVIAARGEVALAAMNLATGDFEQHRPISVFNKTGMIDGLRADIGVIAIGAVPTIAYSVVNDADLDALNREEHPGDITNALIGRVLLEYGWPGEWTPQSAVHPSPYVEELFAQTGL